jgi:hypothetical protein
MSFVGLIRPSGHIAPFRHLAHYSGNRGAKHVINNFFFSIEVQDVRFETVVFAFNMMRTLRLKFEKVTLTIKAGRDGESVGYDFWVIAPREEYEGYIEALRNWRHLSILVARCKPQQGIYTDTPPAIRDDAVWSICDGIIICRSESIAKEILHDLGQ